MTDLATFAGGCFWCTEAIFKRIKGVTNVTSGYSGGNEKNPTYTHVSSGLTGHAEAIQIEYDPTLVSYKKLLQIFWHLIDPTTLNQQGADIGTQYRSVIFFHNEKQKNEATASRRDIEKKNEYSSPIVTEIEPFKIFIKLRTTIKIFLRTTLLLPIVALS